MSSDFYCKKWKKTLLQLEDTVNLDILFQKSKAHDKKRCEAAQRMSGVLGSYMASYGELLECWHHILPVQKTRYIHNVLKAVVSRILELKHELKKLEASEYHFGSSGLIIHKLTPKDAELHEIPEKSERPQSVQVMLEDMFKRVKERKRQIEEEVISESHEIVTHNWWEMNEEEESIRDSDTHGSKMIISEEQQKIKRMAELIQAQERTRQVINLVRRQRNKRLRWEKELCGTLAPQTPYEMRERGARLIQKVCRAYFELKRQKQIQCKRDELLGIKPCLKPKMENIEKLKQVNEQRACLKRKYEDEWKMECDNLKQEYLKRKGDEIRESYRDHIRDWFKSWYESILFFHDIPAEKEKKFEKLEARREEMERKRAEHIKNKMEEDLRRKMMKNPTMHPGFDYPESKKTVHILEAIGSYYRDWAEFDGTESLNIKEKYIKDVNKSKAYMEAKLEVIPTVEADMKNELNLLKKALKKDYDNNNEKMPEPMKETRKGKKKRNVKKPSELNIAEKLEDLVFRGYLSEYPKIKIDEFIGDPNFSGDDRRCDYVTALPDNGEIRNKWWEKSRALAHGFHRILLIGPKGSGKTKLVHILATMNDAVLFELDPKTILGEHVTGAYLDRLVQAVASCAKAVQPSVIHIKHVHRLYYRKVPSQDAGIDWKILQSFFIKKLFKNIHKTNKVTVIGTCVDPWMTKSQSLLKQFPEVILLPNTSYGTVVQILSNWVHRHTVIPRDFNVSCLAHELQGYSFGYLENALEKFLTAETIARIAAQGVSPGDVYNFVIQDDNGSKVDYAKYLKWYSEKTAWGRKEQKHLEVQLQYKQAMADYLQRIEKKKKSEKSLSRKAKPKETRI